MNNASPAYFPSTGKDHAAWVVAVTITFLVYSIIGVVAKLIHRLRGMALKTYDWFVIAALVFAFAQAIVLIRACVHGLGRHKLSLRDGQLEAAQKDYFTATLLLIIVHTLAKISVTLFVMAINSGRELKIAGSVVLGLVTAWGISSVFLFSFQCGTSSPWSADESQCLNEFSVYLGINLGNIITDIALVVLPTVMMWGVQTSFDVKARVIGYFAVRTLVATIIILQTVYFDDYLDPSDATWTLVEPAILGQIALNLSILTACVPSLKGVIEMFWSGASQFTVPTQYTSSQNASGSHGIRSFVPNRFRPSRSGPQTHNQSYMRSLDAKSRNESHIRSGHREHPHTILERSESQTNLNNITRTTEYEVYTEPAVHPSGKAGSDDISQNSTDAYPYGPRVR